MTGRALIVFILANHLENSAFLTEEQTKEWFMTAEEAAAKFGVGLATIGVWCDSGLIPHFCCDDTIYILRTAGGPRENR